MRVRVVICTVVLLALPACSASDDIPAPRIAAITPDHAPVGASVTLTGSYFCAQPEDEEADPLQCDVVGVVSFGAANSTSLAYGDASIVAEVPDASLGSVQVTIAVAGRISNRVSFTIEAM